MLPLSLKSILAVPCLSLAFCLTGMSSSAQAQPDLIIETMQNIVPPFVRNSSAVVPVFVVATNNGDMEAGPFKISAHYLSSGREFVVAFSTASDLWYPRSNTPLPAGARISFVGELIFHPGVRSETVTIWSQADSCSGDEFMPDHCRVEEANEGNNESATFEVTLP